MKLIHRVGYYLSGFSIGIVFLIFFLTGKRASCDYGPSARVIKNISTKKITFNERALTLIDTFNIDTTEINAIIKKGAVNFGESEQRQEPCGIYNITGKVKTQEIDFTIENCDSLATILNMVYSK